MSRVSLTYIDWEVEGVTVLNLTGRLTLGDGTRIFRQLIIDAVGLGKKKVILNLADVTQIDSTGLGELVKAHTTLRVNGGKLKLVKVSSRAQALVQLTRLHTVFELFETEEEALASFRAEPDSLA
ncbi:MAG: STAS domain-containing protein [Acidobacteriota bacterium]|nr:STAS domain-containing protein [Acidobacteriota bacterium]